MKGLLLKDWYQVRTSMKAMYLTVAFVLVIWVFSTSSAYVFPVSYAAVFLGILPINLLAYDQSVGWVEYGRTLPVSKKTLVAEKYLIGLFCAAAAVVIGGLFVTVIPLRTGTAPDKDVLSLLAGSVWCHPADQRYFSAAAVPLWGRKSQHDLYPDLCRTGCPAGRRRCRDG